MVALKIELVNPTPRTYVCGFGACPRLSACPAEAGPGRRAVLPFDLEATFRSTYRFDKLTALRLSKGRLSTGGPSSVRALDRWCGVKISEDLDVDFTNFGPNSYGQKSSGTSFKT